MRDARKPRAFVPRMTLRRAVSAVVPLCALAVLDACKKNDKHIIALAMMAFDAAVDDAATSAIPTAPTVAVSAEPDPSAGVIVLAAIGFDSRYDAGADATPRRMPHRH